MHKAAAIYSRASAAVSVGPPLVFVERIVEIHCKTQHARHDCKCKFSLLAITRLLHELY